MADKKSKYTKLSSHEEGTHYEEEEAKTTTTDNVAGGTIELEVQPTDKAGTTTTETVPTTNDETEQKYMSDPPLEHPEILTTDISFCSKFQLLLWKNSQIQCIRHPLGICLTYGIPIIIMIILVALTTVDTQNTHDQSYGFEFDYMISNTGDAADFGTNYPMHRTLPWPDTSTAHMWMKYLICARNPLQPTQYDKHIPGYLAIVHPDIFSDNKILNNLLNIMNNKYGNSTTYLTDFYEHSLEENTWFSATHKQNICNQFDFLDCNISYEQSTTDKPFEYRYCWEHSNETSYLNFTEGSLLKFFKSEQELEDYIASSIYSNPGYNFENTIENATRPIGAAIVFNNIGDLNGFKWDYKLRVNMSSIPSTKDSINIFERNYNTLYAMGMYYYMEYSGFIQLQTWIDESIMEYMIRYGQYNNNSNNNNNNDTINNLLNKFYSFTRDYSKGSFMFGTFGYVQDNYWLWIGPAFGFYLFIMFCYPITEILTILVDEKAKKIKETLKMMGATATSYWLSWYCWFFISFTLIALIISIIGVFGNVFKYSSFGVIFLWFWLFCLSTGMMCCWMSTWFDNQKTASLTGVVLFLVYLSIGTLAKDLSNSEKHGVCLIAPACFMITMPNLIQYESSQIGINFNNINEEYNNFSMTQCLYMLTIDIFIYMLLNIYFDQVFPSKYGQKQVLWYFLLPKYWCPQWTKHKDEKLELRKTVSNVLQFGDHYEQFDEDKEEAQYITIRKLTKTFKKPGNWCSKKGLVYAVQGVSLDVYKGEIFCLLGHNGAGKSTTISMMTGLLSITNGHAWILNHNINNPVEMNEIRKHLGICHQYDVLWDRLSTKEHLWFFARLKGVPKDKSVNEVNNMLKKTHLDRGHNQDKFPTEMSGGQRRKLSLGIALIGGSSIVFLDEPTSGMDPQNRRITWELIQSEKQNRSIVLTTHFMDEADILGDRIAIMGGGKIKCCGSSSYLKRQYGVGYTLTISLNLLDDNDKKNIDNIKDEIEQIVLDHVNKSEFVSLAGSEITYRLPFESTQQFSTLFNLFDDNKDSLKIKSYGISVTTLEEVFLKVGHDEIEPINSNINVNDENKEEKEEEELMESFHTSELGDFTLNEMSRVVIFFYHIYAILYKRFLWSLRDKQAMVCTLFCPVIIALFGFGVGSLKMAKLTAEPALTLHPTNWYPSTNDIYIPTTNFNGSYPNGTQGIDWWKIPNNVYSGQNNGTFYNVYNELLTQNNGQLMLQNTNIDIEDTFNMNRTNYFSELLQPPLVSVYPSINSITYDFQDWLLNRAIKNNEPIYNSFFFLPYSMTSNQQKRVYFGINGSALHSLPITNNLWNNWIINYIFDGYFEGQQGEQQANIIITSHPLPPTYSQNIFIQYFLAFQQSIYFVIAFSFIPAAAMYFICNERECMSKHQQLVCGVSYSSYWISNYIIDVTVGYPSLILIICLIYIFDSFVYEDAIGWFILIIWLFLWSSTPFTYLLSFLFKSPSKAQFTTIILYMVLGMVLGLVCLGLDFMSSETRDISTNILRPIFRLFPPFILCESLINIGIGVALFPFNNYSDWDVLGRNCTIMAIEGCAYFICVLIIEYLSTYVILLRKCGLINNMPITQRDDQLDDDVWAEKQRILLGIKQHITTEHSERPEYELKHNELKDDSVIVTGLRKVFKQRGGAQNKCCKKNTQKFEAVKGLFFGVKQGECFGFLGVNGAGKTTTLSTLTGAQYPSSGTAFICGHDIIREQLKCRRYIGYVPQFDALFDLLNCDEHLKFYGLVKGLKSDMYKKQTDVLISSLTLQKYRNKLSHTYSGGNKRKLSVAVAMIGSPPVVFLDEPSTGMDPVSRRFMWRFISSTMSNRAVILTTHSMEECEALCNRIGIMVNGQLQCIGNNQHLKTRFGKGYQLDLDITFDNIDNNNDETHINIIKQIQNRLIKEFGHIDLIEHNSNRLSYQLFAIHNDNKDDNKDDNNNKIRLGSMFDILQDMKNNEFENIIDSYGLSQTTLEQVFLRMAKKGEEMKENEQK